MSDFSIEGKIIVDDEASSSLEKVSESADELTGNLTNVGKASDDTSTKMKKLGDTQKTGTETQDKLIKSAKTTTSSYRDLTVGVSNVTTAGLGFYTSYKRVEDMTLQVDKANLKAEQSANNLEKANRRETAAGDELKTAQDNLSQAIEKYGANSDEAAKATETVNQKLTAYQVAQTDAQLATERADLAAQSAKQTQDNYNTAITSTIVSILPQAITLADGLSKTYKAYKDIDFSGLINKFTGKGGITESLGSASGATDGLSSKLGGLNNISFGGVGAGGLIGGLAAVIALAVNAKFAVDQVNSLSAQKEKQTGEKLSTGEQAFYYGAMGGGGALGVEAGKIVAGTLGLSTDVQMNQQGLDKLVAAYAANLSTFKSPQELADSIAETAKKLGANSAYAKLLVSSLGSSLGWTTENVSSLQVMIPKFAVGGVVSKPTVALIGESGPEAVVPITNNGGFPGKVTYHTPITINIEGSVDQRTLAVIRQELKSVVVEATSQNAPASSQRIKLRSSVF